jgi:hypothetical protein
MSKDEIIELELSLLLIKYSESRILGSLATMMGISSSELEAKLEKIRQAKNEPPKSKRNKNSQYINEITRKHPRKSKILSLLYSRFESGIFLPQLHDIKQFLRSHSVEDENLKSRQDSVKKLFSVLAGLEDNELKELIQEKNKPNFSSLGIISDEIMKSRM